MLSLPSLLRYLGYHIYFWTNENNEPIHVHISKGRPRSNATKFWLTESGSAYCDKNVSRIDKNDLRKVERYIIANWGFIVNSWFKTFGYKEFIM